MTFELMRRRWKIARIEMRRRRTVVGVAGTGRTWPVQRPLLTSGLKMTHCWRW